MKELAKKIGANLTTIWNYEHAKRKPNYDILEAMVKKAGVDPAELFLAKGGIKQERCRKLLQRW